MTDIADWLASIGLGEYAQRFVENAIDLSVVLDLTEQDLKDLGVLLGHRRKILRAIADLNKVAAAPIQTATEPARRDEAERRHLTVMICDRSQNFAAMPQQNPEVLEILLRQIADDREVNGVVGEALGVLGQAEPFEPVRDLLHRNSASFRVGLPHGHLATRVVGESYRLS